MTQHSAFHNDSNVSALRPPQSLSKQIRLLPFHLRPEQWTTFPYFFVSEAKWYFTTGTWHCHRHSYVLRQHSRGAGWGGVVYQF